MTSRKDAGDGPGYDGDTFVDRDTYTHAEACTITEASPDSGSTPVVRQSELGQRSSNQSMKTTAQPTFADI